MGRFSSIPFNYGNLGSQTADGNLGPTEIDSFPAAEIPPVYLDPKILTKKTPLLQLFMQSGSSDSMNTKSLTTPPRQSVGEVKFRWAELDSAPSSFKVVTVTGGSDRMTLDANYGLTPGTVMHNTRTGAELIIINMSDTTTALANGASIQSVDPTATVHIFYAAYTTSAGDPVVGDEFIRMQIASQEGETSANFSFDTQANIRTNTMTDSRFAYEFSTHAQNLVTAGPSIEEHERMRYLDFVYGLEACMLLGQATSTTPGGTVTVSNVAVPSYNNVVEKVTKKYRGGMGLVAQIDEYGHKSNFGGGFDYDAFSEMVFEITRKLGTDHLVALCGSRAIQGVGRYQDKLVDGDDYSRVTEKLFFSRIKTIETRTGVLVDLVQHPIMTDSIAYSNTALVFDVNDLFTIQMNGLNANGTAFGEEIQPRERQTVKRDVAFTGALALKNATMSLRIDDLA